jgi:hypothetical protein
MSYCETTRGLPEDVPPLLSGLAYTAPAVPVKAEPGELPVLPGKLGPVVSPHDTDGWPVAFWTPDAWTAHADDSPSEVPRSATTIKVLIFHLPLQGLSMPSTRTVTRGTAPARQLQVMLPFSSAWVPALSVTRTMNMNARAIGGLPRPGCASSARRGRSATHGRRVISRLL